MAIRHKNPPATDFTRRVLAAVEDYRTAPDRQERDSLYIANLQEEIQAYEQRYNLNASEIHERIDDGTLVETADVSRWIIAVNKLERATVKQD